MQTTLALLAVVFGVVVFFRIATADSALQNLEQRVLRRRRANLAQGRDGGGTDPHVRIGACHVEEDRYSAFVVGVAENLDSCPADVAVLPALNDRAECFHCFASALATDTMQGCLAYFRMLRPLYDVEQRGELFLIGERDGE